jgi:hypothetical protein
VYSEKDDEIEDPFIDRFLEKLERLRTPQLSEIIKDLLDYCRKIKEGKDDVKSMDQ